MARRTVPLPYVLLALFLLGFPIAFVAMESSRTGLPWRQVIGLDDPASDVASDTVHDPLTDPGILLSAPIPTGNRSISGERDTIAHVAIRDLDGDGLLDILACDVLHHRVVWIRQDPLGVYIERSIGDPIDGPVHVETADIDADGDLDVLVAAMGIILPTNERIGQVIILEQAEDGIFRTHIVARDLARVTDVRPGDLDGDGDLDLSVAQFGYDQGSLAWWENTGDWTFARHELMDLSGAIHAPVVDLDADGDLDIVALFSQEWEDLWAFENDGHGAFTPRLLHDVADADYSSSGIGIADLDADGDPDILWTNGDAFVSVDYRPLPTHGLQWLENLGDMQFTFHRVGDLHGAYDPCAADLDGDGDLDLLTVSEFAFWDRPTTPSLRWWEQQAPGTWVPRDLATWPTHLVTVDVGDLDGDGDIDIVTGSMNLSPPFSRIGRVTRWMNLGGAEATP